MIRAICFAVIAATLLTGALNISAMPSYDDVLLVVNKQSKSSVEIGNYFKTARKIPDTNVVQVSMTDLQVADMEDGRATVAQKQAMLAAMLIRLLSSRMAPKPKSSPPPGKHWRRHRANSFSPAAVK